MERDIKKIGLINLLVLLAIGVAGLVLARISQSLTAHAGLVFFGIGFLVMAVSYFQMRLHESERLEKLEFDELNKAKGSSSLFNVTDSEVFPAQRAREQFERFFVPGFTVLLFLLQAGAVWWLWKWLDQNATTGLKEPLVTMALFGIFGLILFLLGKYAAGIARLENRHLLRPGASYLLLTAYVAFIVAAGIAAWLLDFKAIDRYAARALTVVIGLAAVENLVNLILEIYRPRIKSKDTRLLYESRLIGLLAQPEGLFTTAAQALDYQFGFKVSETWFYRTLEKEVAWLFLLLIGLLFFSTSFVFIGPGEKGLVERFGRPVAAGKALEPGLHLKLPWPFSRVYRFQTDRVQTFNIGFVPDKDKAHEKTILWTVKHYEEEFDLLVASRSSSSLTATNGAPAESVPVDLLTVSIPVQFQIEDVFAWAYNHTDAPSLLEKLATREVIRYLVSVDLFELMSSGREKSARELQKRIQDRANDLKLGARILFVGLQDIHPPVKVAKSFEDVTAARQENEAKLRTAEGYAAKTVTLAEAEAYKKLREAEAYYHRKVASSHAEAAQFTNQLVAFKASPQVFTQRSYLQTLERGATNARKYVVATTNTQDVIQFNLEDKIRQDLLDLTVPGRR
jgi:modulator of FtsH protease HflK